MTRTAMVVEIGEKPSVRNDDIPSAKAATSRRFWGVRERSYSAANPAHLDLSVGDTVELFLPPGRTVISAALTFLLPLALFPVGYGLAGRLVSSSLQSEGLSFLIGFAALLIGIPLGALARRLAGVFSTIPEIQKILTSSEARDCKAKAGSCGTCTFCG